MKNVYDLTQERLRFIFNEFEEIIVSFSGGKDSGVLLNLCIDYIRKHNLKRKLIVFHQDYECQYQKTTEYVERTLRNNLDILDIYWCCVPVKVTTCCSMYEKYWRPWDPEKKDLWIRELPEEAKTDFPFYKETDFDYDFQTKFSPWIAEIKGTKKIANLIGIRTQESMNRWRAIHSGRRKNMYKNIQWTQTEDDIVYNCYPIYDWVTEDIWVANAKFGYDYNKLYDLYYMAGLNIDQMRVASPFLSEGTAYLQLYRVIDPQTWGKLLGRVNGCNFTSIYGGTFAMGWKNIKKPDKFTWEEYMNFLLDTLPEKTAENYRKKLEFSKNYWRTRGGCLDPETLPKLDALGIPYKILEKDNRNTDKRPVTMEYQDDIDLPEFPRLPSYKRMCICIMKNDHFCKYMGYSPTKIEADNRKRVMEKYKELGRTTAILKESNKNNEE